MPDYWFYKHGVGGRADAPEDGEMPFAQEIRFSQVFEEPRVLQPGIELSHIT